MRDRLVHLLLASLALGSLLPVASGADPTADDPHAHHRQWLDRPPSYERSVHDYRAPDVALLDMAGNPVSLRSQIASDDPVVLSFIFTSCQTVCPVLTATLAQAQQELRQVSRPPRLISVSIDPGYDTPERLRDYASTFRADESWQFLTGDPGSVVEVQRAFDAFRGDKLNHVPLTFLRGPGEGGWVRLEGFTSAAELVKEYRALVER